ncbi:MAG: ribonuclease III domain-containing protein [Candidatus Izemoplasmatales bacterium]|nr:ribonuclease III domain-containing protein [Candidatus Izemoplasmatales bacterium]
MQSLNDHIEDVERKISYYFNNESLLQQAFIRSSYSTENGGENNEVLEFIGDRVLDFYVTKVIADRYGFVKSQTDYFDEEEDDDEYCIKAHRNERDFTELKKEIVNNKTLANRIDRLGFTKYLFLGKSDIENKVWNQEKVKADLFEAILGAIAIDSEWNPDELQNSVEFMLQIEGFLADVEDGIDEVPEKFQQENAINTLKELAEHGRCSIPEYYMEDEQVYDDGQYWWNCTCTVRNWSISKIGLSTSKKGAKRYAAYLVLCDFFGIEPEEE